MITEKMTARCQTTMTEAYGNIDGMKLPLIFDGTNLPSPFFAWSEDSPFNEFLVMFDTEDPAMLAYLDQVQAQWKDLFPKASAENAWYFMAGILSLFFSLESYPDWEIEDDKPLSEEHMSYIENHVVRLCSLIFHTGVVNNED